jgi:hypothetical protein
LRTLISSPSIAENQCNPTNTEIDLMVSRDIERRNTILLVTILLIIAMIPVYLAYVDGLASLVVTVWYVIMITFLSLLIGLFYYLY